ncbi:hypothetical protein M413DRAFT_444668 [Hebeloma cylindrosporum]|uniref:AB hydrolase-1 domain-containing protein n=1 Tax=Hebeloma cylindrosporum TaxID=76867 RepID=A0A0C3CF44_HEBCY|nr:hypothetical protein M413DRAFT_444668 [Hebeloma cylindrosporum h7]
MPHIDIQTATGPFSFCYYIATPNSDSADKIDPNLPSVIFLHAGYAAQEIFEWQFADRNLRQFNLIGIDMRGFGDTKGVIGEATFTPADSAADVEQIMAQLQIPPSHFFGLSNGCTVALELAIAHPHLVLSLTLCSPTSRVEPEDVAFGRMEVYRYWVAMDESTKLNGDEPELDEELVAEVMTGAMQLLFNLEKNNRLEAMGGRALAIAKRNWTGSQEALKQSYKTNIEWFLKRRVIPGKELATINVPVAIIHCSEDIGYPLESAQEIEQSLRQAGVPNVHLHRVPGAHFGNVTHPEGVNLILLKNVLSCHPDFKHDTDTSLGVTHASARLSTPFTEFLVECGYDPEESDSE